MTATLLVHLTDVYPKYRQQECEADLHTIFHCIYVELGYIIEWSKKVPGTCLLNDLG